MTMARTAPPSDEGIDVRWMNAVAAIVAVAAATAIGAAALAALARLPLFTLRTIRIEGNVERTSLAAIRATALPRLAGSFFEIDLDSAREAFQAVPWVRRATVRRIWPAGLVVTVDEHRAAAVWQGEEGDDRLVNEQGEVFEANVGDVEDEGLPTFAGPDGTAAAMLAMQRRLEPVVATLGTRVLLLRLSERGSWGAELDSGAGLEIGRGGDDELLQRVRRFAHSVGEVTTHFGRPFDRADLRHREGFALKLRGVAPAVPKT